MAATVAGRTELGLGTTPNVSPKWTGFTEGRTRLFWAGMATAGAGLGWGASAARGIGGELEFGFLEFGFLLERPRRLNARRLHMDLQKGRRLGLVGIHNWRHGGHDQLRLLIVHLPNLTGREPCVESDTKDRQVHDGTGHEGTNSSFGLGQTTKCGLVGGAGHVFSPHCNNVAARKLARRWGWLRKRALHS